MRFSLSVAALLLAAPLAAQDTTRAFAILPRPASVTTRSGLFHLRPTTVISVDRRTEALGHQLAAMLGPATGWTFRVRSGDQASPSRIELRIVPSLTSLGDEGYRLDVAPGRVRIRAPKEVGVFYGMQTLRQLFPPEIFREAPVAGVSWRAQALSIEDEPRFRWRGGHLDVGRHFMPKEFVKKYIDLLALHKMNVFHWHLTEDQGWRLEIKKYPRLTEVGAWRAQTLIGRQRGYADSTQWQFDRTRHGGFYTQDDAREIVAYAKARFVTVVPEIEMPGHAMAAIAAYPQLGLGDTVQVAQRWGIFSDILNTEPSTIAFMHDVLSEVLAIFPSQFIHIGGDEAEKTKWKANARIQERMRELGVKDEHELQSWFIRQMDSFLTARGRRLVGWDEILEGGLAPNATVMSWRGTRGGIEAARAGHDVIMAPTSHTYLDYYQSRDTTREPLGIGGFLPLDTVYAFEPIPAELDSVQAKRVLGAQVQLWTEYMKTPKHVEYMAFPRLVALSEVVWSPKEGKNFADFRGRLVRHLQRLSILDVNFRPLDLAAATTIP